MVIAVHMKDMRLSEHPQFIPKVLLVVFTHQIHVPVFARFCFCFGFLIFYHELNGLEEPKLSSKSGDQKEALS